MCGNRVEELEARVNELEASVEGLTDELVECKVRLRELENAVDEDLGFTPEAPGPEPAPSPDQSESPEEAEADNSNTEASDGEDSTETGPGDIIVA
jgi:hypothetical protein